MRSKITSGTTSRIFSAKVLGKYDVAYYKCDQTGFIQTEAPYWLPEAYTNAITSLDVGLVGRNLDFRVLTATIIDNWFDSKKSFLDYGGGYGLFVRLMRDQGYHYFRQDPFCENLFAQHFDWLSNGMEKAELLTAWEVFEHLENPISSIESMLKESDTILFSTTLVPKREILTSNDWWYFMPETGQHISLYTRQSFEYLANSIGLTYHTDGISHHILTKRRRLTNPFQPRLKLQVLKLIRMLRMNIARDIHGLQSADFLNAKKMLAERVA